MLKNGFFAERKLIKRKSREADIRLQIDYDRFLSADKEMRRKLIIKNIIDSIRVVGQKAKKDFNGERLEKDILGIFGLKSEQLDNL
jgi:hypothetical protein